MGKRIASCDTIPISPVLIYTLTAMQFGLVYRAGLQPHCEKKFNGRNGDCMYSAKKYIYYSAAIWTTQNKYIFYCTQTLVGKVTKMLTIQKFIEILNLHLSEYAMATTGLGPSSCGTGVTSDHSGLSRQNTQFESPSLESLSDIALAGLACSPVLHDMGVVLLVLATPTTAPLARENCRE